MYCLSRSGAPVPVGSLASATGRAGKFHDRPPVPVERKTTRALDWSGFCVTEVPRLNSRQDRYALPFVSQAIDVSPPACQYWRGKPPNAWPRVKLVGASESRHVRPASLELYVTQLPSPRR